MAAAHVVLYHFGGPAVASGPTWITSLLAGGDASVSLFFILSGFVLTYTYGGVPGPLRRRSFWATRFARLYPVYLVSLLLVAPFILYDLSGEFPFKVALSKAVATGLPVLTLTQAWAWQTANKWNYPGWSLSAEAFFYLLFPYLLVRLRVVRGRSVLVSLGILWALVLAAPAAFLVFDLDHQLGQPSLYAGPWQSTIAYSPLLHLPEFLMGMLLGSVFVRREARVHAWGAFSIGVASVSSVLAALVVDILGPPGLLVHNGLLAPIFGLLIFTLAYGRGPVAWILGSPVLILLGEASYSLYILQYPIWRYLDVLAIGVPAIQDRDGVPRLLSYVCILLVVALLSYRYIEVPGRVALRRWLLPTRLRASVNIGSSLQRSDRDPKTA